MTVIEMKQTKQKQGDVRKPELEGTIRNEIDELLEQSRERFSSGDLQSSLELALKAWDLIPEPKEQWDYYPQSLSVSFVQDYTDLGDKKSVNKWIAIMARMYGDPNHEDQYVLMHEGEAMYRLGDFERAYYVFDRIDEIYGRKGFVGEQRKYLKFLEDERARRRER